MATPERHALLGASSAHRWLACPPSARLEEACGREDTGSVYAAEGTAAHAYAELLLSNRLGEVNNRSYANRMKKIKAGEFWGPEMEEAIGDYANWVMETVEDLKAEEHEVFVDLEQLVDYTEYVPEGFGTADVVIIADDTLHVIDLKYGKGVPVSAAENPQLRLYALGAYLKYHILYDIERVRMSIMQPRLGSTSTNGMIVEDLLLWAENVVKPAAELAWEGEGKMHPSEDACRWCRVKATCKARADMAIAQACSEFDDEDPSPAFSSANPPTPEDVRLHAPEAALMGLDEIAHLLPALPAIEKWAKDVQDYALEVALAGEHVPGYKLVEGRSVRKITNPNEVISALEDAGYKAADILKPLEPKPIGQLEGLLGKAKFKELLGGFVEKPQGKPVLVPESDKRPEIGSAESAARDFEEVTT